MDFARFKSSHTYVDRNNIILCNKMGFEISGRSGSHVRLSKITPEGKVGTIQTQPNKVRAQLCGFLYC